jgi:murein DD-endopeptidase MepM/ murein hydrolase activator NlpD
VKYTITSKFHATERFRNHQHNGIDLKMPEGTSLRAIESGKIRLADYGTEKKKIKKDVYY